MSKAFTRPTFNKGTATVESWTDYTKRVLRGVKVRSVQEQEVGTLIAEAADFVETEAGHGYDILLKLVRWSRAGNLLGSVTPRHGVSAFTGLSTLETTFLLRPKYTAPQGEWNSYVDNITHYMSSTKKPRKALQWVAIHNLTTRANALEHTNDTQTLTETQNLITMVKGVAEVNA